MCDYDQEEDGESESDDYSDASDEESSDVASDSGLSEQGQDWDDLEKEALEEDRKQATVRTAPPQRSGQPSGNGNRRPAPSGRRR